MSTASSALIATAGAVTATSTASQLAAPLASVAHANSAWLPTPRPDSAALGAALPERRVTIAPLTNTPKE